MVDISVVVLMLYSTGIIAFSWVTGELLIRVVTGAAKRSGASPDLIRHMRQGLNVLWIVLAAAGVLRITGAASEFAALTISGLVGLAISLALQTTLSNVISGILLFYDNALRLNDIVQYGGIKGKVVRIALRSTWIQTGEGNIAIISNNSLSTGPLINYTALERLTKKLQP